MIPGGWEWIIIVLVIVLLFGARRLPEMGKSLGQGIRGFKSALTGSDENNEQSDDTEQNDKDDAEVKSE
jgi:sec-independent protein translocase protein TatA